MAERADTPQQPDAKTPDELRSENERLRREVERLRRENERLKKELDPARGAAKRQAAPFSKGAPTPQPKPPRRRAGQRHGPRGHRQPLAHVDETIDVPVQAQCPDCGGAVADTRVADQIQEELPVVRTHVRRFRVHVGRCRQCGRRVQGRHPHAGCPAGASEDGPADCGACRLL